MNFSFYCKDDLWDLQTLFNTSEPKLTRCLGQIGFTLIPNLIFLLLIPLEFKFIIDSTNHKIPINGYNITRILISLFALYSNLILFFDYLHESAFSLIHNTNKLNLITSLSNIIIFTILTIIYHFHRIKGIITSGIIFIITLLFTITNGIQFIDTILYNTSSYLPNERKYLLKIFLSSFCLFILSCFADVGHLKYNKLKKNVSPEEYSSFLSKITLFWFTNIIRSSSKKEIKPEDIYELPDDLKVKTINEKFNKIYHNEIENVRRKNEKSKDVKYKFNWISLLKIIWKFSWNEIIIINIFEFINTLLRYPGPILLDCLITFISDPNSYRWQGIFILVSYIISLNLEVIMENQNSQASRNLNTKLNTSLSSLVYHKSLNLNSSSKKNSTTSELIKISSTDSSRSSHFYSSIIDLLYEPINFIIAVYLLYLKLGIASIFGVIFIIFLNIINYYIEKYKTDHYEKYREIDDERINLIDETIKGIRLLKYYAWEKIFEEKINDTRNKQTDLNLKMYYYNMFWDIILYSLPPLILFICTMSFYIFLMKSELNAQKILMVLSLLDMIRGSVSRIPYQISYLFKVKISLDRLSSFFDEETTESYVKRKYDDKMAITIKKAKFAWRSNNLENESEKKDANEEIKDETNNSTNKVKSLFQLKNIELEIKKGSLIAVIGQIGAGKSSLISAILGEMQLVENDSGVRGNVNISSDQSICYVSQLPWIQNKKLKDNILFGNSFDQKIYDSVIDACALRLDFEQLEGGDETEIGEKGINLSGGQRQRVSLARACYQSLSTGNKNQIILLDDPLSAVDAYVGERLCKNVLNSKTGILKDTTRVLVTNQLNKLSDLNIDKIVLLKNGEIKLNCTFNELIEMNKSGKLNEFNLQLKKNSKDLNEIKEEEKHKETKFEYKKLIKDDKKDSGKIDLNNFYIFFNYFGYANVFLIILTSIIQEFIYYSKNNYLANWKPSSNVSNDYNIHNQTNVVNEFGYLVNYTGLSLIEIAFESLNGLFLNFGITNCMVIFHKVLLQKVIRLKMSFFDCTPIGRVIDRFDSISDVDENLPYTLSSFSSLLLSISSALFVIIWKEPQTLVIHIFIFYCYYLVNSLHINYKYKLKQMTKKLPADRYSFLDETLHGLPTIKAFNKMDEFEEELKLKRELEISSSRFESYSYNWFDLRFGFLSNLVLIVTISNLIIHKNTISSGDVSLIINYSITLTRLIRTLVFDIGSFETASTSIERVLEYCNMKDQLEDEWIKENNRPPLDWPQNGEIEFINYSTKYREDTNLVLKDLNFKVDKMEKIGIVGRTGAGKSTITLSLFRIIEAVKGKILIDNIDISKIGIHDLRSKLSIIPQDPVLFTGTIRFNLDPFSQYSDEEINESLEHAHLKQFIDTLEDGIQYKISEGGKNLSVGQRQLICLARALLRKSKILVLDEATASVDFATDSLVQKTIRNEFKDCTIITIAHRLNTVLDSNRILVIDNGELKEYDEPTKLLKNKNSLFYKMALNANII